jgi:arsenate reductase
MITIYGIKNCDTMQKAMKWLDKHKIEFRFHNYKEEGIDKATLDLWLKHLPLDKLINRQSATYRALTDSEKADTISKPKAIKLMMKYYTLIKRPVWDLGDGSFFLGWDEEELSRLTPLLSKRRNQVQ